MRSGCARSNAAVDELAGEAGRGTTLRGGEGKPYTARSKDPEKKEEGRREGGEEELPLSPVLFSLSIVDKTT